MILSPCTACHHVLLNQQHAAQKFDRKGDSDIFRGGKRNLYGVNLSPAGRSHEEAENIATYSIVRLRDRGYKDVDPSLERQRNEERDRSITGSLVR